MMPSTARFPTHGPSASVTLHFDGSVSATHNCASAAVAHITHDDGSTHTLPTGCPLGSVSSNEAEYIALIHGLRSLLAYLHLKRIRYSFVTLRIRGDSELVINQLNGKYRVQAPNLQPLFALARSLADCFLNVSCVHCPRSQNERADRLANTIRTKPSPSCARAVYYPSLSFALPVSILGHQTLASTDVLTSGNDPNNYIDARFLRSLPKGKALYLNMRSVLPLSLLVAKTNMTILGAVSVSMRVQWVNAEPDSSTVEFLVVHSLPVPVHVSTHHPRVPQCPPAGIRSSDYPSFEAESFPQRFGEHEYWHSNTIFIGSALVSGPASDDEDYQLDG